MPKRDTEASIRRRVEKFIARQFVIGLPREALADEDSFLERGIIDSTGVLELVGFLERTFAIKIDDSDIVPENLDSMACLVRFVKDKKSDHADKRFP